MPKSWPDKLINSAMAIPISSMIFLRFMGDYFQYKPKYSLAECKKSLIELYKVLTEL